jgi:phosphatidylserine decarboxylase
VWNAVFDVTITQGAESTLLEGVCWDKDRFSKDYIGEFSSNIADLFSEGVHVLEDPNNQVLIF